MNGRSIFLFGAGGAAVVLMVILVRPTVDGIELRSNAGELTECNKDDIAIPLCPSVQAAAQPSSTCRRDVEGQDREDMSSTSAAASQSETPPAEVGGELQTSEECAKRSFDIMTDRWTHRLSPHASAEDCERYAEAYKSLPTSVKGDCLRRAINLIPDKNVGLIAGILLDRTVDTLSKREVFEDIVNRPEEVKEPILKEIAKDKTHPCYSDVEWIYEVTGEKPAE